MSEHLGGLMVIAAAIAFYVASRAAADAVAPPSGGPVSAVRHALAQWVAVACVALVAVWLDHPEIAVGVIFSTSVAALSLHLGVTVASTPEARAPRALREGHGFDIVLSGAADADDASPTSADARKPAAFPPVRGSRAWAMVVPAGVLALMAGFSGQLTLVHALLFAVEGLLVVMVWDNRGGQTDPSPARLPIARRAQLALATALALIGAVCAVYGAVRMSDETKIMSTGLIASAALGPLLVLPMIGSASLLAVHGQAQAAVGASVALVMLNLCLLLPLTVVGWHVRQAYFPPDADTVRAVVTPAATQSVAGDSLDESEPVLEEDMPPVLGFPIAVWRIDTVLLILLGLVLLPVALNLWELRRLEGTLLIAIYACYLVITTVLGRRW